MKLLVEIEKEIYTDCIEYGVLFTDYLYEVEQALKKAIILEDEEKSTPYSIQSV